MIASLALVSVLLSAKPSGLVLGLGAAELVAIGLTALVLATHLWSAELSGTARGDATALLLAPKDTVIGTTILMFAYALLIPTPRGRSWRLIAAIAICPLAAEGLLFVAHPEVFRLARQVATFQRIGEGLFMLLIAALLAAYGAYLANTMRVNAREARLFNQYRLLEFLGGGGMGEVYLAEHRLLKRTCAIKLIRPERSRDPNALQKFVQEVRATAGLSSPNIVDVYDYGHTEDGTFFYVMEHLRGLSLEDLVSRNGAMPPGRVIYVLRQACEALADAHSAGLIHRDLKPANIFAARRGRRHDFVKILDFGLVEVASPEAGPSQIRERSKPGSPQYMSPEQISGDRMLDRRCDIYGLGGVAYTLLTARPPFERETAAQLMSAHLSEPVVPPSSLRDDIPLDLEAVILRCLEKDPDERYQRIEEVEMALPACSSVNDWDPQNAATWWEIFESSKA